MKTDLEICEDILLRGLQIRAGRLQELAAEIRKLGEQIERTPGLGRNSYSQIAGRAIHAVAWGLANLHLDGLVSAARDCDMFLEQERGSR